MEHAGNEREVESFALGTNPVDSDSEFENITKEKGARAKISRVIISLFLGYL